MFLVIALAGLPIAAPVSARPVSPDGVNHYLPLPQKNGWTYYPQPYLLDNARLKTIEGTRRKDGGCRFGGKVVLQPQQDVKEVAEWAFNPRKCKMKIAIGIPPMEVLEGDAPAAPARAAQTTPVTDGPVLDPACLVGIDATTLGTQAGTDVQPTTTIPEPPVGDLASSYHSAGFFKAWWQDPAPFCIVVNSVKNTIDWYWNGARTWNATAGYLYQWYTGSGWALKENSFYAKYGDPAQLTAQSISFVHYRNGRFCATIDTHIQYDNNTAEGYYSGKLVGRWDTVAYGGCVRFLHFHKRLKRTLN